MSKLKAIGVKIGVAASAFVVGIALPGNASAASCGLKIGAIGPLSGPAAEWGLAMVAAAEMAAAEANNKGGLQVGDQKCRVDVVSYDSKYSAEGAAAGANNLASQGIKFIFGPVGAPEMTGIKPVAMRNQILVFGDSYAKNAIGPQWPLVFHLGPGPNVWGPPIIEEAKRRWKIDTVSIIAPNDQGGTDIADVDQQDYEKQGVKVRLEYYQRGTTDFSPIITRVLSSHPDAVDTASSPPGDAGVIVKQLRQAGFQGPIGRLGGPGTDEIERIVGGIEILKNFYWYESTPTDDPNVRELSVLFTKETGKPVPQGTSFWQWVPEARLLLAAISKAGTITNPAKVAEALRTLPVQDPNLGQGLWTGKKFFGINQEISFPFGIGIIVDGKIQNVITHPAAEN
ncbi:ABC transporter substrate-binding protein [Acidibrevibacterium fodinaquatile]|uniref:ABC transporter substrate-binding protein n=1 Tax=Acidibrevibacterium fodinaquatile TaxID=1969806 RepID=UPI000E0DEDF6|nr:ABC transporter substrate-binding protein [Acidibrevibacterium fodinaquatile]